MLATRLQRTFAVLVALMSLLLIGASTGSSSVEDLSIVDLQYQEHNNVSRIVLMANLPFMYKVHAAGSGTIRIEIDKADIGQISNTYNISSEAVKHITVLNNFLPDGREITELIIKYNPAYSYSHTIKGRRLFVDFERNGSPHLVKASDIPDESTVAANTAQPVNTSAERSGYRASKPVAKTQTEVLTLQDIQQQDYTGGTRVTLLFDGAPSITSLKVVHVGPPARFVMDLNRVRNRLKRKIIDADSMFFDRIRTAQYAVDPVPVARIVFDQSSLSEPRYEVVGTKLVFTFGDNPPGTEDVVADTKVAIQAVEETTPQPEERVVSAEEAEIQQAVVFTENDNEDDTEEQENEIEQQPEIEEKEAEESSPKAVEVKNPFKVKDDETVTAAQEETGETVQPVTIVTPEEKEEAPVVKTETPATVKEEIVEEEMPEEDVSLFESEFPDTGKEVRSGRSFDYAEQQEIKAEDKPDTTTQEQTTSVQAEPSEEDLFAARDISPEQRRYTGKRVSLVFESIPLSSLVLLLGQMTDKNFLIDPSVRDVDVSISLRDVPWDQALEVILDYHGLGKVEEGNLIRIASQQKLADEADERRRVSEQRALAVPLRHVTKRINYAKAGELAGLVQRNMSTKGSVVVDERTNTLVIRDIPNKVDEHLNLIEALDLPTKQVIVEARIVETTRDFINEFGLQYGFRNSYSTETGNSTGLIFPNSMLFSGAEGFTQQSPGSAPLAVNIPAPSANTSILGTFSNIAGSLVLDAILTAAESDKKVRVLSRPRISAANNSRAEIKSGVEVPYQVVQNNTVSIRFREATLKLEVTPHITSDQTVIMDVVVDKSSLGIQTAAGFTVQTRQATSTIRVKDGGVAVIGGVLEVSDSITRESVPIVSKIPLLGALFRNKLQRTQNTELLIFISPKVIG